MQPQLELNDIVLAESAHWWPLPWGYWAIAIILIALILGALYSRKRHINRYQVSKAAKAELAKHATSLSALNNVTKRAALQVWPREQVASLHASDWHRFMIATMPAEKRKGFADSLQSFTEKMYQPNTEENLAEYQNLMHQWIDFGLPKVAKRRPHV